MLCIVLKCIYNERYRKYVSVYIYITYEYGHIHVDGLVDKG
jgi:hypothetical protein